jgi:transcriptional repressor NrdR
MKCPHCGSDNDKVMESRSLAESTAIRRRRECLTCGYRFTSYERIEEKPLLVIKSNGRREPYDRQKIEKGLRRAVEKRPIGQEDIENVVNDIEDQASLVAGTSHEIESSRLGDLVLTALSHLDKVAYIRFASVYRKFSNVQEFIETIQEIEGQNSIK